MSASRFATLLNHPAGPKTVFFWAPMMKWCLVAAGIKDMTRPADTLSVSQNIALAATGMIWIRWSLIITPVNYSMALVNGFVGLSGLTQLGRIAKCVNASVESVQLIMRPSYQLPIQLRVYYCVIRALLSSCRLAFCCFR
ncbi:Mitochondrial pyruvate carrier [Mycena indigotica]|uniref:Mitochondrial pyruvate carrier n=1 Tax=Mycena indigotica TaxID=2126181 RepID=A0A8H6WE46_9AGAR|nr:Mitochondrial pyruvate carrier [Mycena indigotica]KAF7315344.1 Mitochondrial pyruvate carrier [Mycena indigotica]